MDKKKWWQSKTAWVNILVGGIAVMVPSVSDYINEANLVLVMSLVNLVLRAVTKEGIAPEIV